MKHSIAASATVLMLSGTLALSGCGGGKLPAQDQQQTAQADPGRTQALPPGHPAVDGSPGGAAPTPGSAPMLGDADAPTDDDPLPLKLTGLSSVKEMEAGKKAATDKEAAKLFEQGFRKTFTADGSRRDYPGAVQDLQQAIRIDPNYAQAYRALGYAEFNIGFNVDAAMQNYTKAVQLDPDYGEAHYALAFMYAMSDLERGRVHYEKAMQLGVPDERNLGERFYNAAGGGGGK